MEDRNNVKFITKQLKIVIYIFKSRDTYTYTYILIIIYKTDIFKMYLNEEFLRLTENWNRNLVFVSISSEMVELEEWTKSKIHESYLELTFAL